MIFYSNRSVRPPVIPSEARNLSSSVHPLALRPCFPNRRTRNLRALPLPPKHRLPHSFHPPLRYFTRLLRPLIENFEHLCRILLVLHPARADRLNPLDQMIRHRRLALDAADFGSAAAVRRPIQRLLVRKQFMPVVHRTDIRVSWILTPLPRRVRHHYLCLRANLFVALAQRDRIPVTLRHLPTIQPRHPRRLCQHHLWLSQDSFYPEQCKNIPILFELLSKILPAVLDD